MVSVLSCIYSLLRIGVERVNIPVNADLKHCKTAMSEKLLEMLQILNDRNNINRASAHTSETQRQILYEGRGGGNPEVEISSLHWG